MSTNDVPGYDPANHDELAMGCWAEHADGSLVMVESTEGGRIVYSIFDMAKTPIVEYRDAMPEKGFKAQFSHRATGKKKDRAADIVWTWHDKTPFPWDRIIKAGARDGARFASAEDQLTAAERVAESLALRGRDVAGDQFSDRVETEQPRHANRIVRKIQKALDRLSRDLG